MMLTALIKRQLRLFAVIAVVAMGLTVFVYAKVPAMLGVGVYDATVEFDDASGLYPKANVTYRGVKVGQVSSMDLTDEGAAAVLRLDGDVEIPADAVAELHSTSAIGEQYIDLVPADGDGPFLEEGSVIPPSRSREMPQISPVLDSLNRLLASVPEQRTRRVLSQVDRGLGGAGPELAGVIDGTASFVDEAQSQIDATTGLIRALEPVLATQEDLDGATASYAASLRDFTGELAVRDADLRSLINRGPALESARGLVADLQPTLPMLVANLTTNTKVFSTYLPNIEQTLVIYPPTIARLQASVNPRAEFGDVQLDLRAAVNNPPHCTQGYLGVAQRRSPADTSSRTVDGTAHCDLAPSDPSAVRGGRNLPCVNSNSRGPTPASCGLRFGSGIWPSDRTSAAYDHMTEQLTASDGKTYRFDEPTPTGGKNAWKTLVLSPLGMS